MASIRIISTSRVRAANDEQSNLKIELTPWDLRLLLAEYSQKGLLFNKPKSEKQSENTFIQHLKSSLSRTLDSFAPLAGRFATIKHDDNTTSFFIDCNNEGAQFVHAAANGVSVADVIPPIHVPKIVYSFFPLNGVVNYEGTSNPLLAVQVTELVDGIFIGISINHTVADASIPGLKFREVMNVYPNQLPFLNVGFFMIRIAPFTYLFSQANNSTIGVRPRMKRPLPQQYFGNAIQGAVICLKARELREKGHGYMAWEINKIIAMHNDENFKNLLESWTKNPKILPPVNWVSNGMIMSGSMWVDIYGNDFGWGRPVAVRTGPAHKNIDGLINMFPGVEQGSIDLEACLLPQTLKGMGSDKEFMDSFTSP